MAITGDTSSKLEKLLIVAKEELAKVLGTSKIRLNVMVPQGDFLEFQAWTPNDYSNIETTLRLGRNQGCAGSAWVNNLEVIADLTKNFDPEKDWHIPPEEGTKINKDIKSILSVPIYKPDSYDPALSEGTVIAVFNLDSVEMIAGKLISLNNTVLERYISELSQLISEEVKNV